MHLSEHFQLVENWVARGAFIIAIDEHNTTQVCAKHGVLFTGAVKGASPQRAVCEACCEKNDVLAAYPSQTRKEAFQQLAVFDRSIELTERLNGEFFFCFYSLATAANHSEQSFVTRYVCVKQFRLNLMVLSRLLQI